METLCEAPKSGSGSGVTPEGPTPPAIATVEEQVETVRGLKYTSHVAVTPLTQEQIDRRLTKNFDKTYPVDFYARRSEAWATIGVIPAGASIRDALLAFQTGQVVGFYNPANGQLVYIGDTDLSQTERFILAHELTHALDDQHFGLKRLDSVGARCDDEAFMAGLGAIEGSAQYFATQVLMRFPSDAPVGGGGDDGSLDAVPPFITAAAAVAVHGRDGVHPASRRRGRHDGGGRGVDHVPRLDGADHASGAVAERRAAAGGRAGSGSGARSRLAATWT